jgi:hypothetical protein
MFDVCLCGIEDDPVYFTPLSPALFNADNTRLPIQDSFADIVSADNKDRFRKRRFSRLSEDGWIECPVGQEYEHHYAEPFHSKPPTFLLLWKSSLLLCRS